MRGRDCHFPGAGTAPNKASHIPIHLHLSFPRMGSQRKPPCCLPVERGQPCVWPGDTGCLTASGPVEFGDGKPCWHGAREHPARQTQTVLRDLAAAAGQEHPALPAYALLLLTCIFSSISKNSADWKRRKSVQLEQR